MFFNAYKFEHVYFYYELYLLSYYLNVIYDFYCVRLLKEAIVASEAGTDNSKMLSLSMDGCILAFFGDEVEVELIDDF